METNRKFIRIASLDSGLERELFTFHIVKNTSKEKLNQYQFIVYCFLNSVFEKLNEKEIIDLTLCN